MTGATTFDRHPTQATKRLRAGITVTVTGVDDDGPLRATVTYPTT